MRRLVSLLGLSLLIPALVRAQDPPAPPPRPPADTLKADSLKKARADSLKADSLRVDSLRADSLKTAATGDSSAPADSAGADAADSVGVYSDEQASRGQSLYRKNCVECHSASAYTGASFRRVWGSRSVYELWEQIRTTMPDDNPGKLSHQEYADVVAYLLKLNKLPAGPADLPGEAEKLKGLMIRVAKPGS
ncbi:MAG: cytochrome c [Gemmatimonadales bacterium]